MTTATEPLVDEPSIGVDELPALDQPDERECEMVVGPNRQQCGRRAEWIVTMRCTDGPSLVLLCGICRASAHNAACHRNQHPMAVERVEPIR